MRPPKLTIIFPAIIIGIIIAGSALFWFFGPEKKEFQLAPQERPAVAPGPTPGTEVGTGWSVKEDAAAALQEAAAMALKGKKQQPPDLAVIFASSGSDLPAILAAARKLWGIRPKSTAAPRIPGR